MGADYSSPGLMKNIRSGDLTDVEANHNSNSRCPGGNARLAPGSSVEGFPSRNGLIKIRDSVG